MGTELKEEDASNAAMVSNIPGRSQIKTLAKNKIYRMSSKSEFK